MEEYIEQCDCKEIQGRWEPKKGDVFHYKGRTDVICGENFGCSYRNNPEEYKKYPHMKEYYFEAIRKFEGGYECEDSLVCHKGDAIWLPTQAQLQDMIFYKYKENHKNTLAYIQDGDGFIAEVALSELLKWTGTCKRYWKSMEQLWLSFVMFELYGKVWEEGKWKTQRLIVR